MTAWETFCSKGTYEVIHEPCPKEENKPTVGKEGGGNKQTIEFQ